MSWGNAPRRELRIGDRALALGPQPLLMGIVNASPDSFSSGAEATDLTAQQAHAQSLIDAGAHIVDIGGESASPAAEHVAPGDEIERVTPLVRYVASRGALASVDTWKADVARAAIDAGAAIINDISGLEDPDIARECARSGTALVVMHNPGRPKERVLVDDLYTDVVSEVVDGLRELCDRARSYGVGAEQLIVDPGPDFGKTPPQTIALLQGLARLHELGCPVLLPISRKDFIGALTRRMPRERDAGTLGAIDACLRDGAHILRVHDVRAAATFLEVRGLLSRETASSGN